MFFIDYYFTYKYVLRNLLINKLHSLKNTYSLPYLKKLIIYIPLSNINDLNSREGYNYFYLFKFFFGKRAFINKFKGYNNLGVWTYSLKIQIVLNKKEIYYSLFFIINDIFSYIDYNHISSGIFSKSFNIFYIVLKDLNIFSEKKTNLGLFNLKSNLNFNIFINGYSTKDSYILLRTLKLNLFKLC